MLICGMQKLTLLDYPGKMACTIFTGGCNFRCPFCHNASLVLEPGSDGSLAEEDVLALLRKRHGILDGICVTGGEPLLQPDLSEFLEKVRATGAMIKLDTNGSFPEKLEQLIDAGLVDYVAMDLKASKSHYGAVIGMPNFDITPIETSVRLLQRGTVPFEFRTTLAKGLHTQQDVLEMAQWIQGAPRYYLQGFVDSGNLIGQGMQAFSEEEMHEFLALAKSYVPATELRGVS